MRLSGDRDNNITLPKLTWEQRKALAEFECPNKDWHQREFKKELQALFEKAGV